MLIPICLYATSYETRFLEGGSTTTVTSTKLNNRSHPPYPPQGVIQNLFSNTVLGLSLEKATLVDATIVTT